MFENIFEKGYLVDLHIRRWSFQVQLDPADLGFSREDVPEEMVLGRKYLLPREEADKFRRTEMNARSMVKARSFNFPIGNLSFVPVKLLGEVQQELETYKLEYEGLAEDLLKRYDELVVGAEPRFRKAAQQLWKKSGKTLSEEEFVSSFLERIEVALPGHKALRSKFEFVYNFLTVSLPGENGLLAVNAETAAYYQRGAEKQIGRFLEEVVKELREKTYDICTHVAEMIGEGKVVSENTMQSLRDFVDRFRKLNFVGDQEISKQLKELETQWLNKEAKEIRETPELQEHFRRALEGLSEKACEMSDVSKITGRLKRQIQLD